MVARMPLLTSRESNVIKSPCLNRSSRRLKKLTVKMIMMMISES